MNEFTTPRVCKTSNKTILVVASDPKFLKFLEMSLHIEFEHEILSFTRGKRALDLSKHIKPDLFIIDYHILDLSAFELSFRLHDLNELKTVPTLVLNSPVVSWSEPQPYKTAFLPMQFALEDLYSTINEYLGSNQ